MVICQSLGTHWLGLVEQFPIASSLNQGPLDLYW